MSESMLSGRGAQKRHCLVRVLAGLLLVTLATPGFAGEGADAHSVKSTAPSGSTAPQHAGDTAGLPRITVEARRNRQALRLKVDQFVTSMIVQPEGDSLYRWNQPICPLVAGLPKNFGEFILERISKTARDAHAPLAGRVCHPNLYVIATEYPDLLLKKWWTHDREMYNYHDIGIEAVERFIDSPRPIRVWYNTEWRCSDGVPFGPGSLPIFRGGASECMGGIDSRLTRASTGSNITSAIVVIDLHQMKSVTVAQMANYVALVGLADVRSDANPDPEPSILELFSHGTPPQGLSLWDRALLYSLYDTNHWEKVQVSEMELTMVRRIAP